MRQENRNFAIGVVAVLVIILLGAGAYFMNAKNKMSVGYQAVFLSNGQVYFGKIYGRENKFVTLTDVYYLQMKQQLQNQNQDLLNQPDLTLIKLGNELHGPTSAMQINSNQILFIEDLKSDSKVVQAIQKSNNK